MIGRGSLSCLTTYPSLLLRQWAWMAPFSPSVIKSSLAVVLGRGQTGKKDEKITQPTGLGRHFREWELRIPRNLASFFYGLFSLPLNPGPSVFADNYVTLPLVTKELNCCLHPSTGRRGEGQEEKE